MIVTIDTREQSRIKPAIYFFSERNTVSVEELDVGDYVFKDEKTGKTCAFEYKTCSDFINSVQENKVFNQAISQVEHFNYHFVVVQYTEALRQRLSEELWYRNRINFSKAQFYGAIARLNTYTTVLSAHNTETCFQLMEKQAQKCFDDKTVQKSLKKVTNNSAMNYLTNCCRGIGTVTAENITCELKLFTLKDLLGLDREMLLSVNGVGGKTADKILDSIKRDSS